ncbi:MAG: TIM barrel protein [Pseudoxanthomonas sp.]
MDATDSAGSKNRDIFHGFDSCTLKLRKANSTKVDIGSFIPNSSKTETPEMDASLPSRPSNMTQALRFALNRISAASMPLTAFAAMAKRLGAQAIEIRIDLPGAELLDGTPAREIAAAALTHGLTVRSLNALQRFEQYDAARALEAAALVRYAVESGTQALVLCPTNSSKDDRSADQRHADLVSALRQLQPLLADNRLTGLLEPLGFEECAMRRKSQAVRAIREVGGGTFALVHDTFHHHLAGESLFFPEMTGLVHISGVEDGALDVAQMRDAHRVLVGPADRLDNATQLRTLLAAGYAGYISFEPFADQIATAPDIEQRLSASMAYVSAAVAESGA